MKYGKMESASVNKSTQSLMEFVENAHLILGLLKTENNVSVKKIIIGMQKQELVII